MLTNITRRGIEDVVEYNIVFDDGGNIVELVDQYIGACQCNECGRWYNLFGQELQAPEMWTEDCF